MTWINGSLIFFYQDRVNLTDIFCFETWLEKTYYKTLLYCIIMSTFHVEMFWGFQDGISLELKWFKSCVPFSLLNKSILGDANFFQVCLLLFKSEWEYDLHLNKIELRVCAYSRHSAVILAMCITALLQRCSTVISKSKW